MKNRFTVFEIKQRILSCTNIRATAGELHATEAEIYRFCQLFGVAVPVTDYRVTFPKKLLETDLQDMSIQAVARKHGTSITTILREIARHGINGRGKGERI